MNTAQRGINLNDELIQLENMAIMGLTGPTHSPDEIRAMVEEVRGLTRFAELTAEDIEQVAKRIEERVTITQQEGSAVTEREHQPWLNAARAEMDPYYWVRYKDYLFREKLFPPSGISTLDEVTDRILDLMENPANEDAWDRRGMVIGHVQSGKTANYTGLICKAADAGYKLIVVIAGVHNNLRSQTQSRIDEGFVGRDSARLLSKRPDRFVGVGIQNNLRRPVTFTNTHRDFNKTMATGVGIPLQNLTEPAVFVIKKNSSTLKNLIEWIREHSSVGEGQRVAAPMLLIDDEADNASINIRHGAGEVSRINGQIRELLRIFSRSCYVGYTATPFANIFIDPGTKDEMLGEDLFPRSFIVSLDPPSNYFGASAAFLDNGDLYIRHIDDNDDQLPIRHAQDIAVSSIPQSLNDAVRTFILGRAIRLLRRQEGQHSSMLVNASRFMNVQSQLRNEIHSRLDSIQSSVRVNGALPPARALADPEIDALREVWMREFSDTEFDWPQVQKRLHEAASPIAVVEVNSRSRGTLDYAGNQQDGLNVIAVGGFSLSRGLTLEGLMVSYFLRNSMMYDTLMQMGRWFGYRQGYEDLCRIWMPEEARGWYEHIAESIEELRVELRSMEASGATPEDFGLKVRSHPDTLIVTARNKMGTGAPVIVSIGLAGKLVETHILRKDPESLESNRVAAGNLSQRLDQAGFSIQGAESTEFGLLLQKVPVGPVLEFLREYRNHEGSLLTYGDPIRRYIEERADDELTKWDVLFASVREHRGRPDGVLGRTIWCQQRGEGTIRDPLTLLIGNRQRVSGRGIERSGLTTEEIARAEKSHRKDLVRDGRSTEEPIAYSDRAYREVRTRPLLVVHLIDIIPKTTVAPPEQPVVAWSISFPYTQSEERIVQYMVNTTWLRENFRNDVDEVEMQGDDN